ncbi:MAG: tripartite tricarboxylate transporter substrate binding protein [Desulfobacteraceae bacterium]
MKPVNKLTSLIYTLLSTVMIAAVSVVPAAAEYPSKPINVVVGWGAGGGVDTFTRIVGKYAPKYLGQRFVVTNKKGGAGLIAINGVLRKKADGYHLAAAMLPNMIYQPTLKAKDSDSYKRSDLIQLGTPVLIPSAFHVRKDSRFKTLQDVVDYAKANPGKLKVGTNGIYSGGHGLLLMFMKEAGVQVTPVHYNSGAKQIKGLLGGEIDVGNTNAMHTVRKAKDLRTLAVAGEKRYRLADHAPTFKEQGLDIVDYVTRCIVAPKGTPDEVVAHLQAGFLKMKDDPKFVADLEKAGLAVDFRTAAETVAYMDHFILKNRWIFDLFKKEMTKQ